MMIYHTRTLSLMNELTIVKGGGIQTAEPWNLASEWVEAWVLLAIAIQTHITLSIAGSNLIDILFEWSFKLL